MANFTVILVSLACYLLESTGPEVLGEHVQGGGRAHGFQLFRVSDEHEFCSGLLHKACQFVKCSCVDHAGFIDDNYVVRSQAEALLRTVVFQADQ
ncbi:hypothetical protein D3C78_1445360 [compost metagenome]